MYPLMKLPSHNRITQSIPDAMHTVKDVVERVFHLIIGKEDSRKVNAVEEEVGRCNFTEVHVACTCRLYTEQ